MTRATARLLRSGAMLVALTAVLTTGCRSATSPERHTRPSGVSVTAGGTEVVRVQGTTVTGSLEVAVGQQTDEFEFTFLDAQGNALTPPPDYHLDVRLANETFATFNPTTSPYTFRGRLQGITAGNTTATIRFMHGPPDHFATHPDYTSAAVPVVVN